MLLDLDWHEQPGTLEVNIENVFSELYEDTHDTIMLLDFPVLPGAFEVSKLHLPVVKKNIRRADVAVKPATSMQQR